METNETMMTSTPKISPATIARTVCLAIAMINQILVYFGVQPLPFVEEELYELLSLAVTFVMALITWWKNNSFTKAAILADVAMKELKDKVQSQSQEV